jgi:dTDP-4-dehydrorhamnose reductase
MNILIFGASGFIGQDFLNRFSEKFGNVYVFSRINDLVYDCPQVKPVLFADLESLTDISCVLHFAFDHSYRENIKLAECVYSICNLNECPLIYLSSFVVRDLLSGLSLKGTESRLNDPYTLEKARVKRHLELLFDSSKVNMLQIEPGIVFGMRGGWFDHVREVFRHSFIFLSNSGKNITAFIYVGELSSYIYEKSIEGNFTNGSVLIASDLIKSWSDFYCLYGRLMGHKISIKNLDSRRLHPHYIVHILMSIIIFTKVGKVLFKFTPTIKYYFKKLARVRRESENYNVREKTDGYRSYGVTCVLQTSDLEKNMSSSFNDFTKTNMFTERQILEEMKND